MCQRCDIENERQRVLQLAKENPTPCVVCGELTVVGAGSWLPDSRHRLATGGSKDYSPMFSFCLCQVHSGETEENDKLIKQAIVRGIRTGQRRKG